MKRVLILVEGQTEERFVKDVLRPSLWPKTIDVIPKVATTKRVKRSPDFKGGITDYQKTLHGPLITGRIGLEILRRECQHFREWLNWLEKI